VATKCLLCSNPRLEAIETAVMNGASPDALRKTFGCKSSTLNNHIRVCMLTKLADRVAAVDGGSSLPALRTAPALDDDGCTDWLKLPAIASDLRRALHRLESVANRAAIKGSLGVEIQALQTTLRGLEQRAKLGGLERAAANQPGNGWSLTIVMGGGTPPVTINALAEPVVTDIISGDVLPLEGAVSA